MNKSVFARADRFENQDSLVDSAYAALEQLLVTGKLLPGQIVTEPEMSRRLRIGRTPVREALQRLEREGLVCVLPRRGIQVTQIDIASQLEWIEVRYELEKLIARLAARRANASQRQRMVEIARELDHSIKRKDMRLFMHLDREVHELMLQATGNAALADMMRLKQGLNRRFWYHSGRDQRNVSRSARLHVNLVVVTAEGNEAKAEQAAEKLIHELKRVAYSDVLSDRSSCRSVKLMSKPIARP